jgi:RNA polymerase sigma-70 factor (ECF subfamily)
MDRRDGEMPEQLLAQARAGDVVALGHLLDLYRNYLRLVARSLISQALRVRVDPSDLVQETFLKAGREFNQFVGEGEPEFVAWLRQILSRSLLDQAKHHQRQTRDLRRQESLETLLQRPDRGIHDALASLGASPSSHAIRRERAVLIADALAELPPDYREVFLLRAVEHVPLAEIATRMGRSSGAVRMLWVRVLERLNRMLEENS